MPQTPRRLDATLSAQSAFGAALREARMVKGLSQAQLSAVIHVSPDLIAKFEKADRWPRRRAVESLDRHLDSKAALIERWLAGEAERAEYRSRAAATDGLNARHWTQLLAILSSVGNASGSSGLLDVVSHELEVISLFASSAKGQATHSYQQTQARWMEFGSWIADVQGDQRRAMAWLHRANDLCKRAEDPIFGAYVTMRRAQRALDQQQPRSGLDLLASISAGELPAPVRALVETRAAHAQAATGQASATRDLLKSAFSAATRSSDGEYSEFGFASHGTPHYVTAYEGVCLLELGMSRAAVRILESVLHAWPPSHRLDEGLFRAQLALAYAATGSLDEAVREAKRSLELGRETSSLRTVRLLDRLMRKDLAGASGYDELAADWREHRPTEGC